VSERAQKISQPGESGVCSNTAEDRRDHDEMKRRASLRSCRSLGTQLPCRSASFPASRTPTMGVINYSLRTK